MSGLVRDRNHDTNGNQDNLIGQPACGNISEHFGTIREVLAQTASESAAPTSAAGSR